MEYKEYHVEETPEGFSVYENYDAWLSDKEAMHSAETLAGAKMWVDKRRGDLQTANAKYKITAKGLAAVASPIKVALASARFAFEQLIGFEVLELQARNVRYIVLLNLKEELATEDELENTLRRVTDSPQPILHNVITQLLESSEIEKV